MAVALALALAWVAGACAAKQPRSAQGTTSELTRVYALSFLEAGPETDALARDRATRSRILGEHAAYHGNLVDRGTTLLMGTFGERRPRWSMRGLVLLDTESMDEASGLMAEDPGRVAGLFTHRVVPLRAPRGLGQAAAAPLGPAGPVLRSYCVLTAPDGRAAVRELERPGIAGRVVFIGRMGGDRDGELFAILDVASVDVLEALAVACSADLEGFEVAEWLSSPTLAERRMGQGAQSASPAPPMIEPSK